MTVDAPARPSLDRPDDAVALTPAQRAVWVASEVDPDSATDFHLGWTTRFSSAHDPGRLAQAVARVLRGEPRLSRTVVADGDEPRWVACDPFEAPAVVDLRGENQPDAAVAARVDGLRVEVALGAGRLLHRHEILMVPDGYVWAQAYHHVLVDGRSIRELTRRVLAVLRDPDAAPPASRSAEAPESLRAGDAGRSGARPADTPRSDAEAVVAAVSRAESLIERPARGIRSIAVELDPDLVDSLPGLADRCGLSVGRTVAGLIAAYTATVRGPGAHAVRLAVAAPGDPHVVEMRSAVVPLPPAADGDATIEAYLRSFDEALSAQRPHLGADPGAVADALRTRFGSPTLVVPGINVMLGPDPGDGIARSTWVGPSTDLDIVAEGEIARRALRLVVRGRADDLELAAHASGLAAFLASAVAAPDRALSAHRIVDEPERALLLATRNDTGRCLSDADVVDMVFARARNAPSAVAVADGDRHIDYRTLLGAATRIARTLRDDFGAAPETIFAIDMHRSAEMVAAILGILLSGAAFVPLDPAWPHRRRASVVADAGARAVLVGPGAGEPTGLRTHAVDLAQIEPAADLVPRDRESLAYVIFTSGSTGTPKGAMIRHGAIASRMRWQIERVLGFGADDASLFKAPLSFDISINEVLLPLCSGGTVVVARDGEEREPERLLQLISQHGVTFTYLVASMLDALLDSDALTTAPRLEGLRHVWCGGELLTPELFARFRRHLPHATMYHGYGPAEATIGVSHIVYRGDGVRSTTSIGRPNPGCRLYVLDRALRPVPAGMGGELYVAGDLLGRGYVNAPALTASRFVANPFHDPRDPASTPRLYRTGDRARWNRDELEFLGRTDNQVKIGGMRVELEEIERAIAAAPGVRACVVVVRGARVHAYVVPEAGAAPERVEVSARERAIATLPRHMVPAWVTALDALPTTANGKVDRAALPEPVSQAVSPGALDAAQRPVAEQMAAVLGVDPAQIGPDTGFFTLGGDSLAAVRLANRLSRAAQRTVPTRAVFDHPTVAELTRFVENADAAAARPRATGAADRAARLPATPGQRRMWLASQLDTTSATYTVPLAFLFPREPDRSALRAALADTTRRHPALRTLLSPGPDALVADRLAADDPRAHPGVEDVADVDAFLRRPFDLASAIPIRVGLSPRDDGWLLVIALHHSAVDEASEPVLLQTLSESMRARCAGTVPVWAEVDAVVEESSGESAAEALARLAPLPDRADVPGWSVTTAGFGRAGATRACVLTGTAAAAVRDRARGGTVFELAVRAVATAVERLGGPADLLIASPVARTTPDDGIVGCHITTTLFAARRGTDLRPQIVAALDTRADVADLVAAAPELRDRAAPRIMVVHQSRRLDRLELGGVEGSRMPISTGTAKFDATITVAEVGDDLAVELEYATDALAGDEAERFLRQVRAALEGVDAVDTVSPALLDGGRAIDAGRDRTLVALIARGVSDEARRIAGTLAARGIGPGSVVGVCAVRGSAQVDLVHGIVLAGAAYVPIDPAWPAARREAVVADAGAHLVLEAVPDRAAPTAPPLAPRPDDAAYVLFTSGSTGRPKGVVVSHRAIVNRLLAAPGLHGIGPDDVILYKTPFTFDVSVWELFLPAVVGVRQAVAPPDAHRDPAAIATAIVAERASVVHFVPSVLAAFLEHLSGARETAAAVARSLRVIVCSGEALTAHHLRGLAELLPGVRVDNLYGPTEAAVDVTAALDVTVDRPIGIGLPLVGVACRILDATLQPVVPGAVGDLYLCGVQLARGYANRPSLTAERFVADPFAAGARMYDTGDRVRQRPDGTIDYLGRRDQQVKVGGQRIELGDVEAALVSATGVEAAAAFVVGSTLVAVYVGTAATEAVRAHAGGVVPAALVPARLTAVAGLPLTPHGKLDRAALPQLDRAPVTVGGRAPAGTTEVALAAAFAAALGASTVPADADFFALGGDSISAIAVVTAAQRRGIPVSVVDLFETRTVEGLAARCAPPTESVTARPVPLPPSLAAARTDGLDVDTMTVSVPLQTVEAEAARRALTSVVATRPELRVRLDRSRARLWRAFQVDRVPPGDGVDLAQGRLVAVEIADGAPRLVVHRMALPADAEQGARRLAAEVCDVARTGTAGADAVRADAVRAGEGRA
ncbi:non-ribosomal peptide synthetase [Microbacterium testaceum]|uniref:non-ribosomal peptide synthetase n=1 Tax=Microbacterium testaceum TaxID=2033 RepID=UPI0025B0C1D7|nr:non-ribosomal peptide synthetase [Microbacterium testaceum]WJS90740.1 amino acid adenylation domain-containing protein [Microbacterium testaceum]